jgi:hypothetical protein
MKKISLSFVSSIRNEPQDKTRRKIFCQKLLEALEQEKNIFYID